MAVAVLPTDKPQDLQRRGTTTATLTIPSRTGHRRVLHDYFVAAAASSYSDISIGNVTWNRIYDSLSHGAPFVKGLNYRAGDKGFLWWLANLIPNLPFPNAADDEDITIARNAAPTRIDGYFQDVTEGDVKSHSADGGSLSLKQLLLVNLNNGSDVTATGFFDYDTLDMPVGLNPFVEGQSIVTAGRRIPSSQRLTLYAIAADLPLATTSTATRVHIQDEQIELFSSENKEGLFTDRTAGQGSELDFNLQPIQLFRLPTPYVMDPNRLFTFRGEATYDGADKLPAGTLKLFLVCMREYLGGGA